MTLSPILSILFISTIASLGTGLGGLLVLIRKPDKRSFGFLMGMTAGVMISLSFLELVNEAWRLSGWWTATIGFGLGAISIFLLDFFLPHIRFGETETHAVDMQAAVESDRHHNRWGFGRARPTTRIVDRKLFRAGVMLAIGITIHNLPEGFAVGAGYMHLPQFGIFIAIAIMLHNIPEGIATALPLYESGLSKRRSFRVTLLSGLVEPLGALLAAIFLSAFQPLIPGALAFAGGVMMFITLDELIPMAREHGHEHYTAIGIIAGSIFVFILSGVLGV
jgi:zinc transporter, ZIP family